MCSKKATREAYGEALAALGSKYDFLVLDADLSKSTKTDTFKKLYPDRFINAGIAEGNMMTTAAGIASTGMTAFASSFAIFAAGRAFEQIRNSICYPKLSVIIAGSHAGISVGEDGASHQAIEDISLMRTIPNMTVISPADDIETIQAVEAAIRLKAPVYLRLGRLAVERVNKDDYKFELGKGSVLAEGNDAAIIATGLMVQESLKAREMLLQEGIKARVINIHTIKPIDEEIIIKAAKETGRIVTCEEHNRYGGLSSAVAEVLSLNCPVKMAMAAIDDKFGQSGKPDQLLKLYEIDAESICKKVKSLF